MGKKNKSKTAAKPVQHEARKEIPHASHAHAGAHKLTIEIPAPQIVEEIAQHNVPPTINAVIISAFLTAAVSFVLLFVFQIGGLIIFGISAVLFVALAVLFYLFLERN